MTYRTHKQYSIAFAYIALMILYTLKLFDFNYYLCFPIILLISQWGAKFPDLDHNFNQIKDRNVLTWIINKLIHLTGGHHRSWQTHSWDICIIYAILSNYLTHKYMNGTDAGLAFIINCGFISGWVSHLFSDMLNGVGIRLFCWYKQTIALVPKRIYLLPKKIVNKFKKERQSKFIIVFNTGGDWELFNYKVMRVSDVVLGIVAFVFPYTELIKEIISNI